MLSDSSNEWYHPRCGDRPSNAALALHIFSVYAFVREILRADKGDLLLSSFYVCLCWRRELRI